MKRESATTSLRETKTAFLQGQTALCAGAALLAVLAVHLLLSCFFDFRFDLNDDVMIRRIVSGAYTGTPRAHNIQMLYPLGAVLAALYRLVPGGIDWYGGFLEGTQIICAAVVLGRLLERMPGTGTRVTGGAAFLAGYLTLFSPHIVFCQYTVVCAVLSGTAVFLFLTGSGRRNDAAAVFCLWLAFLVRSEMMLLTLPIVCTGVIFRALRKDSGQQENNIKTLEIKKCCLLFGTVVIGMGVLYLIHNTAYGSPEWKAFNRLFDNRTELYDFHRIPDYEKHADFYESIGLQREEQTLLDNYNYGLSESTDAELLGSIAEYARDSADPETKRTIDIKSAVSNYLYRLRNFRKPDDFAWPTTDAPWNIVTIACYLFALFLAREEGALWKLPFLFVCRSGLWGYILIRGRDPVRITHGLYLVELLLLAGYITNAINSRKDTRHNKITCATNVLLGIAVLVYLPAVCSVTKTGADTYGAREESFAALYAYMEDHPDRFFVMDVYSWVPYTEKLSGTPHMRPENSDIAGGWICKSPLTGEKLAHFGYETVSAALRSENGYFVQETGKDTEWLSAYLDLAGHPVTVAEEARIGNRFTVYRVTETTAAE